MIKILAYIGGKYRQAKWNCSFIPSDINRYSEVFGGAMWTYINGNIDCKDVHYNDFNKFMVNLFACCSSPEAFHEMITEVQAQDETMFNEYKAEILEYYNGSKEWDLPNFDIGAMYAYIVTQCFSGIMSENVKFIDLKGKYNSKYNSFASRLAKPAVQRKLVKLKCHNESYETFIPKVDQEGGFLYLDPPYYGTESLYAFHDFGLEDHKKLADMMKECKSKWMLSYYDFPHLSEWFPKDKYHWEFKDFAKASMASKGKKQTKATEVLVMNY